MEGVSNERIKSLLRLDHNNFRTIAAREHTPILTMISRRKTLIVLG